MFKFRLESVLDYRTFLEDRCKMVFAEKQRVYMDNLKRGEMLKERRIQYNEALRNEVSKEEISVTMLSAYRNYIHIIEMQIASQAEKTAAAKVEMEKAKVFLIEARKRKEVMVKAKQNSFAKYRKEQEMKDMKRLDEVSSIRYIRANRGLDPTAQAVRI